MFGKKKPVRFWEELKICKVQPTKNRFPSRNFDNLVSS